MTLRDYRGGFSRMALFTAAVSARRPIDSVPGLTFIILWQSAAEDRRGYAVERGFRRDRDARR